jgi:hypothetical protein
MNSIHEICKQYGITNYTINDDGTIDVNGNVSFHKKKLTEIPLRFNKVEGNFSCSENKITTLKGSPRWVGGWFSCRINQLNSLEFGPKYVGGYFTCSYNKLTSLEFSPDYVGKTFDCSNNNELISNFCETEIVGGFYTSLIEPNLIYNKGWIENYEEYQKLMRRKNTINKIFK